MPLFSPPDVAKLQSKGDVDGLVKALRHKDAKTRQDAAQALGAQGSELVVEPLIVALKDAEGPVRAAAASALGQLRRRASIGPLVDLLRDDDPLVRGAATQALGQALPYLARALSAEELVRVGQGSIAPLVELLRLPDKSDWEVKVKAAAALGEVGDRAAAAPLVDALAAAGPQLEGAALITALGRLGDQATIDPILHTLIAASPPATPGNAECQRAAIEALAALGERELPGALVEALAGRPERLGEIDGTRAVRPLIHALGESTRAGVSPEAWSDWAKALYGESSHWSQRLDAAAAVLRRLGASAAVSVFTQDLRSEDERTRLAGAALLGRLGAPALEPLTAALTGGSADVRRVAAWSLGQIGEPAAVGPLIAALADDVADVRAWAARSLGRLGDARAVLPLIATLEEEDVVAQQATKALGSLGDARAVSPLGRMLPNLEALEAMVRLGPPALAAFRTAIADDNVFVGVIGGLVYAERRELAGSSGLAEFVRALRERYVSWSEATRGPAQRNPLQMKALGRAADDSTATAIDKLTLLSDFSLLPRLQSERDKYRSWADREDTSEGGLTTWQIYGGFIQAVDRMVEQSRLDGQKER